MADQDHPRVKFAQLIDEISDAQRSFAHHISSMKEAVRSSHELIAESRDLMLRADRFLGRR